MDLCLIARAIAQGMSSVTMPFLLILSIAGGGWLMWNGMRDLPMVGEREEQVAERLIDGAATSDLAMCVEALERGAPIDSRSRTGCTPLMFAASAGDVVLTRRLLLEGADVSMTSDCGLTALALAAMAGKAEVVELLLNAGASADQPTMHGGTALHAAAGQAQAAAAMVLVAHGADVNARDGDGCTPLMLLVSAADPDLRLATNLIAAGTDLTATDRHGNTAERLAELEGRADLIALIHSRAAGR